MSKIQKHITRKNKVKTKYIKKNVTLMKGGRVVGEGSFGCVVTPSLSCDSRTSKNDIDKTVSKIVLIPDEFIEDEINIAMKLKGLDPMQKYFITPQSHCKISKVPDNRSNVTRVKYTDNSSTYYKRLEAKPLDKKYCPIDLSTKPINLIMPYGGFDLIDIADALEKESKKQSNPRKKARKSKHTQKQHNISEQKIVTANTFFENIKSNIKNLLMGLYKMHQNKIVNRDIKEENIMVLYNKDSNTVSTRFIDFGLSEVLTPEFCSHYSNISKNGTRILIAPEIFICYNINKYRNNSDEYILKKINNDISLYVKKMRKDLKLNIQDLQTTVEMLFITIKELFKTKKILTKYFGTEDYLNGYLQKNDIYSLGLTLYEFLVIYTDVIDVFSDIRLHDLLKNMIELNPEKRYNVLQCLKHPYFT